MSRERNEHSMESGMESIRKGYIYISTLLFQILKKIKNKIKKGIAVPGPVPLLPVPVPLMQKGAVGIRYWYHLADLGQIRVFNPFLHLF